MRQKPGSQTRTAALIANEPLPPIVFPSRLRQFFASPDRATAVLACTEILSYGILFYSPALLAPLIAAERGWSLTFAMSGLSIALFVSAMVSPLLCGRIDRFGGNGVMSIGALLGAAGYVLILLVDSRIAYVVAWMLIGGSIASTLYDPAFATLGRIFGLQARRPIAIVAFCGGLSSTIGWFATQYLTRSIDWHGAYGVFALVLVLVVAPLHAFMLPRERGEGAKRVDRDDATEFVAASGLPFLLVAAGFATQLFVFTAVAAHLIGLFGRGGLAPQDAVAVAAFVGPALVAARLADFLVKRKLHPLLLARGAMTLITAALLMLLLVPLSFGFGVAFALVYGAASGVMTIARGALPLVTFGPAGYGRVMGRISRSAQIGQAIAPFALAFVLEYHSPAAALELAALSAFVSLLCFMMMKRAEPA